MIAASLGFACSAYQAILGRTREAQQFLTMRGEGSQYVLFLVKLLWMLGLVPGLGGRLIVQITVSYKQPITA